VTLKREQDRACTVTNPEIGRGSAMSQASTTIDHVVIRRWIEERDGRPAVVSGPENRDGREFSG